MADKLGKQIGNYRLVSLIGQGGFAEVYLAEHVYLKTHVALKVLHTTVVSPQDLESFLKEAQTIAHLQHPHIIRVMDFGLHVGNIPYLMMEYAPNGSLRQLHPKGTPLPLPLVLSYVKQIALALQYAHDEKFVHRDVKPENMLLGRQKEVLLSDFGIALITQSSHYQSTQDIVGTVAYMSPEQIHGKPRPASDQYSLGIVVYEWVGGDRPFHGSFTELCTQHMFSPPPSLREKLPTISPDVEMVVMKALAKDPRDRYARIQQFAEDLEKASVPTQRVTQQVKPVSIPVPPPVVPPVQTPLSVRPTQAQKPPQPVSTPIRNVSMANPQQGAARATSSASASQSVENLLSSVAANRKISRRKLLTVAAGTGAVISAGGIYWLHSRNSTLQSSLTVRGAQTSTVPSTAGATLNTPAPGTTLYTYRGHSDIVQSVAWSPDGKHIASGSGDNTVQVWDALTGMLVVKYTGHSGPVLSVGWSPDGKHIASGSTDNTVQVWGALTGQLEFEYRGHSNYISSVAWSPDGKHIASASYDKTVKVWDALTGMLVVKYTGFSASVAWSPDGKKIASASGDKTVQVWNSVTGNLEFEYGGYSDVADAVAWSPDGKHIASGGYDNNVQVWNALTGMLIITYTGHTGTGNYKQVSSVAWSPDGKHIASGGYDKTVRVWEAP